MDYNIVEDSIIRLKVPYYQIGEPVHVYFKDTMYTMSICEPASKHDFITETEFLERVLEEADKQNIPISNGILDILSEEIKKFIFETGVDNEDVYDVLDKINNRKKKEDKK